jgi:PPP family 3-phenylpropionic acid transporter
MFPAFIFAYLVYGAVTPFLPLLVRDLGFNPFLVGVLLGVFEGSGIAGPFLFGYFADRRGQYKTGIVITYLISVITVIPLVLFVHPALSVIFIALFAFAFRSTAPLLDAAATIYTGNYGKIRAAGSVSFIVIVLFLQWTPVCKPDTAWNIALWIAISSGAAILPTLFLPGKSKYSFQKNPPERSGISGGKGPAGRIWTPLFFVGFLIIFLCRLAMSPIYSFFPLYLTEFMHWDAVGAMFALAAAAEVPFMFLSARLLRRFKPLPLLALSAAAISIRLGMYALLPFRSSIIIAQLLHSLCFGLFHPAAVAFISQSVPPKHRALGMSLYLSLGSGLPALIGNVLGGIIVEHGGYSLLFGSFTVFSTAAVGIFVLARNKSRSVTIQASQVL